MSIKVKEITQWLSNENPFFDGTIYIFPNLNIAAFGLNKPEDGIEITAYADSVRSIYEKDLNHLPRYKDLFFKTNNEDGEKIIIPNKGVGNYKFGMKKADAINLLGQPQNKATRSGNTDLLYWDKTILRFENDGLVQVTLENSENIFLEGEDISKTGPTASILKSKTVFKNRAYKVYFDIGIALTGFANTREPKTIIVFAEAMKSFWSNTKRPLI